MEINNCYLHSITTPLPIKKKRRISESQPQSNVTSTGRKLPFLKSLFKHLDAFWLEDNSKMLHLIPNLTSMFVFLFLDSSCIYKYTFPDVMVDNPNSV